MRPRVRTGLILAEAAVCFALPAYGLFWGVVTVPLWYAAWMRGGTYAAWNLAIIAGGCVGVVGLAGFVRHLTAANKREFAAVRNTVFSIIGLLSLSALETDWFASFSFDFITIVMTAVPSACFAHFVVLAIRKSASYSR